MKNLEILKIVNENNKYFEIICNWMYEWWGEKDNWSLEKVKEYMRNSMCTDRIPQTFIAVHDNEVVGMYQISMNDLDVRPDIYPWLINVYVEPKYRGNGICKKMVEHCINEARELNLENIYLYTKHVGLYEKYGFNFIKEINTFKEDSLVERLYVFNII